MSKIELFEDIEVSKEAREVARHIYKKAQEHFSAQASRGVNVSVTLRN